MGLKKSCVTLLLFRVHFDRLFSKNLSDKLKTWRAAMVKKVPSLQAFLFQIEDRVYLGWTKKPGGWVKMTEEATRKLIESENICPASIEPCESCERCVLNVVTSLQSSYLRILVSISRET